ncbi:hypothetical protein Tco_0211797 [Tanacetum coccineum]
MEDYEDNIKDLSNEEVFEAGDEMETDIPHATEELSSPSSSTDKPNKSKKKKVKELPKPDESPEAYHFESSSASLSFKDYDNYMTTTERVLAKNLQGFSKVLYAQIIEDNWAKHEKVAASYVNLRAKVEAFIDEAYKAQGNIDASLRNYEKIMLAFKEQHLKGINTILTNLHTV